MSRPIFPAGGFGYALNYPKEIARDRAELAKLEKLRDLALVKPDSYPDGYSFLLADLVCSDAAAAARLGYTLEDRQALAGARDYSDADYEREGLPIPESSSGASYRRGSAICKELGAIWEGQLADRATLKKWISKAKADLARHLRNQAKHG